jgi:quercetin dioxygenase-like cupin family protein
LVDPVKEGIDRLKQWPSRNVVVLHMQHYEIETFGKVLGNGHPVLITPEVAAVRWVAPPGDFPPHKHKRTETIFVLSGQTTIYLRDEPHVLGPGDSLQIPSMVEHRASNSQEVVYLALVSPGLEGSSG